MAINKTRITHLTSIKGQVRSYFLNRYGKTLPSLKQMHLDTNEIQDPLLRFCCTLTIMGDITDGDPRIEFEKVGGEILKSFINDEISYQDLEDLRVEYLNWVLEKINLVESE